MILDKEEIIGLTEKTEERYHDFLREFENDVWPIFKKFGYTRDTSLLFFKLNNIENAVCDLCERLDAN